MNTKKLFITILFIGIQIANGQNQPDTVDYTQEHIEFLKEFYMEYVSFDENQISGKEAYQNYLSVLEKYCTPSLNEKILQANKTLELDYNPFIYSQDYSSALILQTLQVEKYGKQKNLYEVSFCSYKYFKQNNCATTKIKFKVINTENGCKINAVGNIKGD